MESPPAPIRWLQSSRTFAGDMLDAGADVGLVLRLMGHSSVATTVGYDRRPRRSHAAGGGARECAVSVNPASR